MFVPPVVVKVGTVVTYHGSIRDFHGPFVVSHYYLDEDSIRYELSSEDGPWLTNVRRESFSTAEERRDE